MKIGKNTESCYRMYQITVNGREYHVEKIVFYDENGIVVSTNHGWLSSGNSAYCGNDIHHIELPIDSIKLRRKEKFNGEVFAMLHKEAYGNDTVADLYIPAEMLHVHGVGYKIQFKYNIYAIYEGDFDIHIESYIKSFDENLNIISNRYNEVYSEITEYELSKSNQDENDFLKKIDSLKSIAKKYFEEVNKISKLTIDDFDLPEL